MTIERERAVGNAVEHIGGERLCALGVTVEQRAVELEFILIQGSIIVTRISTDGKRKMQN